MQTKLRAFRAVVERVPTGGQTATEIRSLLTVLDEHVATIVELKTNPDPMLSQLAIDKRLSDARTKLRDTAATARARSGVLTGEYRSNLHANQKQTARLVPNEYSREIRDVFRALDLAGKNKLMAQAIESGDASTIAAITEVPYALTGLSSEMHAGYRDAYLDAVCPIDFNFIDELENVTATALKTADEIAS
jgi:hypothetical protein